MEVLLGEEAEAVVLLALIKEVHILAAIPLGIQNPLMKHPSITINMAYQKLTLQLRILENLMDQE